MISQHALEMFLEDINKLEDKIRKIYYLEQFDDANHFEQRLSEIRQILENRAVELSNNSYGAADHIDIINKIYELEFDINTFIKNKMIEVKAIYKENINKIISNIDIKNTRRIIE